MTSDFSTGRSRVHEESCTESKMSEDAFSHSLVLALSTDNDSLALPVPSKIINLGAEWSDGKLETVFRLGRIPDSDISRHIRRSAVKS